MKEAGTGDLYLSQTIQRERNPLNPFKQFSKEIRDREQVGKNQGPDHYSLDIYLNPFAFCYLFDPNSLILLHPVLPMFINRRVVRYWTITEFQSYCSRRFFTIFRTVKPPTITNQITKRLIVASSLIQMFISIAPPLRPIIKQGSCQIVF